MENLPKKIEPCPIVESIFEIRFSSSLPEDAIFGIIYSKFRDEYPTFEQLPILQLPPIARAQDPNLRYSPHYKTQKDNFVFQIGPKSFSFSIVKEYVGWEVFSEKIFDIYEKVKQIGVIDNVERLGLRYINILEGVNIFENSNFIISLKDDAINRKTSITTEIPFDKGNCTLRATSDAEVHISGQKGKLITGSVIDIDAVVRTEEFENTRQAIEHAHDIEKTLFFNILTEEFIKKLSPEY